MIVLSIDSSSSAASVALMSDDKLISEITYNDKKEHSVLLMSLIDQILKKNNLTLNDLDGFVISKGPGSFTGLRIGMATVKGLCTGSNKPCVAISSLDSLAYNVSSFNGLICPVMDALRGNVYTCIFKYNNGSLKKLMEYDVLSVEDLKSKLLEFKEEVIFVGDGLTKHREWFKDNIEFSHFAPNHNNYTKASSLGELGLIALKNGESEDLFALSPLYLRKSQAEREYDKKMGLE